MTDYITLTVNNIMQHQLVFQFPINEEFYFDSIIELETKLTFELDGQYTFEKHEFAAEVVNVYIATDNPDETVKKIISILSAKMVATLKVGVRQVGDDNFTYLYPPDYVGEFKVT